MSKIAIIAGSSFLKSSHLASLTPCATPHSTAHGDVLYHTMPLGDDTTLIFIQRHAADPAHEYTPPHLINTRAILRTLADLQVSHVLAFGSTGTLHPDRLPRGSLLVPDDYANQHGITSFYEHSFQGHRVAAIDSHLRAWLRACVQRAGRRAVDGGVYVQATGPRFETAAEIRHFASYGDVVGMTCAHEITLANEVALPYAVLCVVDNVCNGITKEPLSVEEFHQGVADNQRMMDDVLGVVIEQIKEDPTLQSLVSSTPAPAPSSPKTVVDTIVLAHTVLPCAADRSLPTSLAAHAVVMKDGDIVDVCPNADAVAKYTAPSFLDLSETHILTPGFVNAHTHMGMSMLRGFADDMALIPWLTRKIWPAEGKHVSPEFVRAGTQLAAAELLRSGVTCVNDMYFYPAATAEVFSEVGMRAVLGLVVLDFPSAYATETSDYLAKGRAFYDKYRDQPLISFALAPHAPYTVSDESLKRVMELANELDVPIHMHVHETKAEVDDSIAGVPDSLACHRSEHRCAPLENLDRLGLVNDKLIAVHMTQLTDENIAMLAERGAHVVHCPQSNLKLASGFCPIAKLHEAGVNVCIGTDSTASNNSLDLLAEMKTAAILAKAVHNSGTAVPADEALRMATINGARALRLDHVTGSLEVGKSADLIAHSIQSIDTLPLFDAASHLVYTADRHHITDVWVHGQSLLANRLLATLDEASVRAQVLDWQAKLQQDLELLHD